MPWHMLATPQRISRARCKLKLSVRLMSREGRLGVNGRGCASLPVTVNEASDSGAAEPAASTPLTQAPSTIRIQLPRGEVHVDGSVDADTLRIVIQCLSR